MGTSIGALMQFIRNHYERAFQDCAAQKLLKHLWESAPQEALTTYPVKFFVHSELRLHDRAIAMPVFAWNPDGPLVDPPSLNAWHCKKCINLVWSWPLLLQPFKPWQLNPLDKIMMFMGPDHCRVHRKIGTQTLSQILFNWMVLQKPTPIASLPSMSWGFCGLSRRIGT